MMKYISLCGALLFILTGCNMVPPNYLDKPEYSNIRVTAIPPAKSCEYLGEVYGKQGNWFSGIFTSNVYLIMGAMNELRNNSAELNANYLYVDHLEYMGPGFLNGTNYSTIIAQAYRCEGDDAPEPNLIKQRECGWFSFCLYTGETESSKVNIDKSSS